MKPKPKSRASALLLATILLFAILTVIISLSSVTVMEMKMGQKGKTSVASFYDAESGVEWALNTVATGNGDIKSKFTPNSDGSITCPAGVGGAGCKVYFLKADGTAMTQAEINASSGAPTFADVRSVRSVGREGNDTQRAIEAAVATSGDYQIYCWHVGTSAPQKDACVRMNTSTGATQCKWANCDSDTDPCLGGDNDGTIRPGNQWKPCPENPF